MSLRAIVAALGGDIYAGGARANIPAPGHSAADRSVSLLLDDGRVIVHGFGAVDWREARDHLRRRGLIDGHDRPMGGGGGAEGPRPGAAARTATAARLWAEARPLDGRSVADRHLVGRAVRGAGDAGNLGFHPRAPVSVYRSGGPTRPALIARISDADDRLTAVELTYLQANGRRATDLHLSRKTVGCVPPGSAVRLKPVAEAMLVGEGVVTTLSAMARFGLPGWALRSAKNLATWTPPPGVRRVLIAADRGAVGEAAALRLRRRLLGLGLVAEAVWPEPPYGDWNDVEVTEAARETPGSSESDLAVTIERSGSEARDRARLPP